MRLRARATLSASVAAVVVNGLVFGISNTAVTPPSTAPREPLSRSSLCCRPGSRQCTCVSITPRTRECPLRMDTAGQHGRAARVNPFAGLGDIDAADGGDTPGTHADITD